MATPHSSIPSAANSSAALIRPSFREAFLFWLKLGFISFGGPTGQIAIMHNELVERRRWIGEAQFLHGLNFCMLLPGPEAQQLAIYIGWLLHRTLGGLAAGVLFVLPSAFLLWLLSYVYVVYGSVPWISAVFEGLKPAVLAIVADAIIRIGKRALKTSFLWCLSGVAFIAIYFLGVPFPAIVFGAALIGLFIHATPWSYLVPGSVHGADPDVETLHSVSRDIGLGRIVRVLIISSVLWFTPILLSAALLGSDHVLVREGVFFSKAAIVTFGGAYAVLPYVAQQAVDNFHWLAPQQMLDGLALAETTPGPLIMVVQFVGFLGAWNHPGSLPPLLAATLGAAITTWSTFVPCFLWIFLGAPYIETMRKIRSLSGALTAITAAVVGVVLNLAVWFASRVLIQDGHVMWFSAGVTVLAFVAMRKFKVGVIPIIVFAGVLGLAKSLVR